VSNAELTALERRLRQVENAISDAEARLPGMSREVRALRAELAVVHQSRRHVLTPGGSPPLAG
jgi:hypothetical protein